MQSALRRKLAVARHWRSLGMVTADCFTAMREAVAAAGLACANMSVTLPLWKALHRRACVRDGQMLAHCSSYGRYDEHTGVPAFWHDKGAFISGHHGECHTIISLTLFIGTLAVNTHIRPTLPGIAMREVTASLISLAAYSALSAAERTHYSEMKWHVSCK